MNETPTEEKIESVSNELNNRGTVLHEGKFDDAKCLENEIKPVKIDRLGKGNEKEWMRNTKKGNDMKQ